MKISKKNLQQRLNRYAHKGLPKRCRRLGSGYSRTAYLDPREDIVYKLGGSSHNLVEWAYWYSLPKSHRKFFAEVYGISDCGSIIAMRYVPYACPDDDDDNYCFNIEGKVERLIKEIGLPELTNDIHFDNIGFNKRWHVKVFDYGEEMYDVGVDDGPTSYKRRLLQTYKRYFRQKSRQFKQRRVQKALMKGVFK